MLFIEDGQVWESFVYVPKKPIARNKQDGTYDASVVNELVIRAKAGDNEAQMLLFEQFQYKWKKEITSFVDEMLTYEDAQQEAFYALMISLRGFSDPDVGHFTNYFMSSLHNHLIGLTGKVKADREMLAYSLDERDEEGNLIHDLPERETEIIPEFPRVKALLTDLEYRFIITRYYFDFSMLQVSRYLGYSYDYVREVNSRAVNKLKVLL